MSLKESRAYSRKSLTHQFISGVYSSCILKIIVKMRKNFEFLMESLEEIEKIYFKQNDQNFLHVSKEYEYLVRTFGNEYDKTQKNSIIHLLESELIRPLSELTKNRDKFEKDISVVIKKLKSKHDFEIEEDNFEHDSSNFIHLKSHGLSLNFGDMDNFKKQTNNEILDVYGRLNESYDTNTLIQNEVRNEATELLKIQNKKLMLKKELNDTLNAYKIQSTEGFFYLENGLDSDRFEVEDSNSSHHSEVYMTRELSNEMREKVENLEKNGNSIREKNIDLEVFNMRKMNKPDYMETKDTEGNNDSKRSFQSKGKRKKVIREMISINDIGKISENSKSIAQNNKTIKDDDDEDLKSPVQEIKLFGTDYKGSTSEDLMLCMLRESLEAEGTFPSSNEMSKEEELMIKKLRRAFIDKENYNASNVDLHNIDNIIKTTPPENGFPNLLKSGQNTSRDYEYELQELENEKEKQIRDIYVTFKQQTVRSQESEHQIGENKSIPKLEKKPGKVLLDAANEQLGGNNDWFLVTNPPSSLEDRKYSQARSEVTRDTTMDGGRISNLTLLSEKSDVVINKKNRNLMNLLTTEDEEEEKNKGLEDNKCKDEKEDEDRSVDLTKCSTRNKLSVHTNENLTTNEKSKRNSSIWRMSQRPEKKFNYTRSPIKMVKMQVSKSKAAEFFKSSNSKNPSGMRKLNLLLEADD